MAVMVIVDRVRVVSEQRQVLRLGAQSVKEKEGVQIVREEGVFVSCKRSAVRNPKTWPIQEVRTGLDELDTTGCEEGERPRERERETWPRRGWIVDGSWWCQRREASTMEAALSLSCQTGLRWLECRRREVTGTNTKQAKLQAESVRWTQNQEEPPRGSRALQLSTGETLSETATGMNGCMGMGMDMGVGMGVGVEFWSLELQTRGDVGVVATRARIGCRSRGPTRRWPISPHNNVPWEGPQAPKSPQAGVPGLAQGTDWWSVPASGANARRPATVHHRRTVPVRGWALLQGSLGCWALWLADCWSLQLAA
ncbi:hypothetical protein G7046_g1347 [Stylonectria norvegica]|nr:hypothetical protein G7046_g1347 [Stylonectria norvegica]